MYKQTEEEEKYSYKTILPSSQNNNDIHNQKVYLRYKKGRGQGEKWTKKLSNLSPCYSRFFNI